jgi:hypothetical protein
MNSLRLIAASIICLAPLIFSKPVLAEEVIAGSVYDQDRETETVQRARRRAYPGGRDEADLVVQAQLTAPVRKMTPQMESTTDTGADE